MTSAVGGDRAEPRVDCAYCGSSMLAVVLGWLCPKCAATRGERAPARRRRDADARRDG